MRVSSPNLRCCPPANHAPQTVSNHNKGNIFVVIGTIAVTALLALFIYASRIYTNRTALAAIPKPYIPIEEGELAARVRAHIAKNRQRSALIAWESRPRDLRGEETEEVAPLVEYAADAANDAVDPTTESSTEEPSHEHRPVQTPAARRKAAEEHEPKGVARYGITPVSSQNPPWGTIEHPGWCAPHSHDLPNLNFMTVVAEIPNLIEAKAVSLAPPNPSYAPSLDLADAQAPLPPPPDSRTVALLQRPANAGLREYLSHLEILGVAGPPELLDTFLGRYEYARFSGMALREDEFRALVDGFSEVLVGMRAMDDGLLQELLAELDSADAESLSAASSARTSSVRRSRGPPPSEHAYASASQSSFGSASSVVRHGAAVH